MIAPGSKGPLGCADGAADPGELGEAGGGADAGAVGDGRLVAAPDAEGVAAGPQAAIRRLASVRVERARRAEMGITEGYVPRRFPVPGLLRSADMDAYELAELLERRAASGRPYLEFLTVADLSVGLYVLAPGEEDRQEPHTEDEVYYVTAGRARITVGDENRAVREGSIVFVAAGVPHRFHDIAEELRLLVVFGPAEYSRA